MNFAQVPSPKEIKDLASLTDVMQVENWRNRAKKILAREDPALAVIVGPCSLHDRASALEYAEELKKLSSQVGDRLFLIMRTFFQKPRTRFGWKGILSDPYLDGTNDLDAGLRATRKILIDILEMGVPIAAELLDPLVSPYFDDLLCWGFVGARTSASQPHRQMASSLHFPVGFKNSIEGENDVALSGILTSRMPHSYLGIDQEGKVAAITTMGNRFSHLVLRGSFKGSNFDPASVTDALSELKNHHLEPRVLIDCSHGNCEKDHRRQTEAFHSVLHQVVEGNEAIVGVMIESHLEEGRQPLSEDPSSLRYGVSITDACLGWKETKELLLKAHRLLESASVVSRESTVR